MYKIKHLTKRLWFRKLNYLKKRYTERSSNQRFLNHFKRSYETNQIYCNICEKSLVDQIGKDIAINSRKSGVSKWYHISCALEKNMIYKKEVELSSSLIPVLNIQRK